MPITVTPYVPTNITVHLGAPGTSAANVTVPFSDYIKNVASSEIYPTWNESALRANILAITSFALNRIYTEFYRGRGYPYDITSSTAYDQKFIPGRNYFTNISQLVDELFDDYLRRPGFLEPLAAQFCNGTTVTCSGLSQWGSEYLARQGFNSVQILRNYYGNNIEIVNNAPIQNVTESYPGTALRVGSRGLEVSVVQTELNRIAQNYPAIPRVAVDGVYGPATEASVREFQRIFNLVEDGVVGRNTWYALVRVYVGVNRLSELQSQGQTIFATSPLSSPANLSVGTRGDKVRQLQYMLSVLASFIQEVQPLDVDSIYGSRTEESVRGFQRYASLPITGSVDFDTWDAIYDEYAGVESTVFDNPLPAVSSFSADSEQQSNPVLRRQPDRTEVFL